jgi:hypothetical protein
VEDFIIEEVDGEDVLVRGTEDGTYQCWFTHCIAANVHGTATKVYGTAGEGYRILTLRTICW